MADKGPVLPAWIDGQTTTAPVVKSEAAKPRFIPKVPVKKEASANTTESAIKAEKPVVPKPNNNERFKNKDNRNFQQRNNFKPNFQGRGAGGRGQWVMPTGTAFFSGNTTAPVATIGANGGALIGRPDAHRIMRPNEAAFYAPSSSGQKQPDADVKSENDVSSATAALATYYANKAEREDEDSDDVPDEVDPVDEKGEEMWPPTHHDPLAPVSLPLGPKSANMRLRLAAEPILADPNVPGAVEKEESSALFLIQMPSDLHFDKILESRRTEETDASSSGNGVSNTVKNGRLGKMQLLSSGKVRLITESGQSYEVSSGLAASFCQYLSAVQLNELGDHQAEPTSVGTKPHSGSAASKSKKGSEGSTATATASIEPVLDPNRTGSIHFMSTITKKLVITPDYEIGTRKSKVGTSSHSQHHREQSAPQDTRQEELVEEDEDVEDMYEE